MSHFWRNVSSVLVGTAVAQAIPIVGSLIIARQYAPAEFGVFSAWLGIVMLIGVVLTGRFEMALAIEADGEPRRIGVIATLITTLLVSCFLLVVLGIAMVIDAGWFGDTPRFLIFSAVPAALAIASTQTWQSWAAADGYYRKLSIMRISQAALVTLIQIIFGIICASASMLALAYLLGTVASLTISVWLMPIGPILGKKPLDAFRNFWHRHYRFPLLSLPADAISTAAAQLPILIVASRFGAEIAGLLAMTMRILGAPIGLLGKSVLDVFKRHAAASFRERGECRSDYVRTFKVLALGSLAFCAVMVICSEALFALAFGETWRGAGAIAVWLLPLFALRFVASPLSYMVYIADKQHVDLIWQIALFIMTFASLSVPQHHDFALQAYSVGYSLLYIIYLAMSYRFSLGDRR